MTITLLNKIGSGAFGSIYKAEDEDGNKIAIKIIDPKQLRYIEIDILSRLRSPYLIKSFKKPIVDTIYGKGVKIELKENSIDNLPIENLSYYQIKRIMMSCLYGLRCMHENNFLHLDISTDNILYDVGSGGDITAFLGDFGFSVRCSDVRTGIVTSKYANKVTASPEIVSYSINRENGDKLVLNEKTDVWSLGIVFLYLIGYEIDEKKTYIVLENSKDKIPIEKIKKLREKKMELIKNIDEDFIEERIRIYNKKKMSPKEVIELKELLINMLKFDKEERMSMKDLERMSFYKNQNLRDSCMLEKPREVLYLPYISKHVTGGIKEIQNRYKNIEEYYSFSQSLEEYFLVIQTFIRLMTKSKPILDEDELKTMIDEAVRIGWNYYRRKYDGGKFAPLEKFDGEIGYNPYFYKASCIDDLIILNYYLTESDTLLSFYNLINPKELFDIFREDYNYSKASKNKVKIKDFFKLSLPTMKNKEEVSVLNPEDYYNELPMVKEKKSLIEKTKMVEEEFRNLLVNKLTNKLNNEESDIEKINTIYNLLHYNINSECNNNIKKALGKKNISVSLRKLFDYGIIKIRNDVIVFEEDTEKEYVIIIDDNKSSLLHIKDKKVVHYYSDKNMVIKKYYEEKDMEYCNNFRYGIGTCCLMKEPCLIFNIYYNQVSDKDDFSTKCLEKNTFFLVLVYTILS